MPESRAERRRKQHAESKKQSFEKESPSVKDKLRGSHRFFVPAISVTLCLPVALFFWQTFSQDTDQKATLISSSPLVARSIANQEPEITQVNEQLLIQEAASRLGSKFSQEEMDLWQSTYALTSHKLLPIGENLPEGERRINAVIDAMQKSNNPFFQVAAKDLKALREQEKVYFSMSPVLLKSGVEGSGVAAVAPISVNEKLVFEFRFSLDAILNQLKPENLATAITHEVDHLRRADEFQASLDPLLSIEARVQQHQQKDADFNKRALDEALAYGLEAEAYIFQYGLGFTKPYGAQQNLIMSFIAVGMDRNSSLWHQYIRQNLRTQ